jgi:biotin synthase
VNKTIADMAQRVLQGGRLGRADLLTLVDFSRNDLHDLLYWAWRVRFARFGRRVRLCSIIAGKLGGCGENCRWCAQSAAKDAKPEYATIGQILQTAQVAHDRHAAGIGIVNSGRRPNQAELQTVIDAAAEIRRRHGDEIYVCASLGELTPDQASRLAGAGVQRYNHNLESSRRFYPSVVGSHSYDDRLATLANARQAGMKLCCGGIFGLGETWEDRVDLALTLRDEVGPEIVPLNFLHPIVGTPMEHVTPLAPTEALAIIAIFRLAMPEVDLKIAGGRESNFRSMQSWIFHAGATSIITGGYLTTPGQGSDADLRMIQDLGLEIVSDLSTSSATD